MCNKDWTSHCKMYAFTHNITYMEALKCLECQTLYTKKEKKNEGIKQLRKTQNELVINYLNNRDMTRDQFQQEYLEIEKKIKNKMEDSKRYRQHYKNKKVRCV